MTDYTKHPRLSGLASLVLLTEASGTKEAWRQYIETEMKTAGLNNRELRAEIARQKAEAANGGK